MLSELTATEKVVGLKQTRRAIEEGRAAKAFVACDAESRLREPLMLLCKTSGVPSEVHWTMKELGKACGIAVGTAAAAILAVETKVSPE